MNKLFSFAYWLDSFFKARGHKYIKRVPSGTTKTGRIKYRYIYKVGHTHRGKHVDHHDDMVANAKFMVHSKSGEEIHMHIERVREDGKLVVSVDDGEHKGVSFVVTKEHLAKLLDKEHNVKSTLDARKKKLEAQLKRMKESGKASDKQIARVQRELDRYKIEEKELPLKKEPVEEEGEAGIMAKVDEALSKYFKEGARSMYYSHSRPEPVTVSLIHNGTPIELTFPKYGTAWTLKIGDKTFNHVAEISKPREYNTGLMQLAHGGQRSVRNIHRYDDTNKIPKKTMEDILLHAIYSVENPELFKDVVSDSDKKRYRTTGYAIFAEEKKAIRDRLKQQKKTKKKKPPTPEVKTEPPTPEVKTDPTPAPPKKEEQESDFSRFESEEGKEALRENVLSRMMTGKESAFKMLQLERDVKSLLRSKVYANVGEAVAFYEDLNTRLPKSSKKLKEALIKGIELPDGVTIKADLDDFGRLKISKGEEETHMSLVGTDYEPKYFSVSDEEKIFLMSDGGGATKKVSRNDLLAHLLLEYRSMSTSGGSLSGRFPRKGAMSEHKFVRALYDEATDKAFKKPAVAVTQREDVKQLKTERTEKQKQQDATVTSLMEQIEQDPYKIVRSRAEKKEQKQRARAESPLVDLNIDSLFDESSLRSRLGNVTHNPERMITNLKRGLQSSLIDLNHIGHNLLTESNQAEVQSAISKKEKKLKELYMAYVNAKANTSNWAVTGRGGRNNRRENKKLDAEKRKLDALLEFINGAERSLVRELSSGADTDAKIKEKETQVKEHMEEAILAQERANVFQDATLSKEEKIKKLVQLFADPQKGERTQAEKEREASRFLRRRLDDPFMGPLAEAKQANARLKKRKRELFELKGIKKGTFTQYADLFKHLLK